MRFLKQLVMYALVGGLLLWVSFYGLMHGLVLSQAISLSTALTSARQMARKPTHASECMIGQTEEEYPLAGYQVRFENDNDFVVEAVCVNGVKGPFEVRRGSIGLGVSKEPGFSGAFFPILSDVSERDARVVLRLLSARWVVDATTQARMAISPIAADRIVGPGLLAAKSTCEGWGYECCNPLTQAGEGSVDVGTVLSCGERCYQRCLERPAILVFGSEPQADAKDRMVILSRVDAAIIFSYSVQDVDSAGMQITIDFGDGQRAVSTNQTDQFSHRYECKLSECRYSVNLTVVDSDGLEHARTRVSEMTVVIR